jgi:hypothetical protein
MFRSHVSLAKHDDIDAVIRSFKKQVQAFKGDQEELVSRVESTLHEFAARGEQLAGFNSAFIAKRVLKGVDFYVVVEVDFGRKRSLISRLIAALRG